MDEAVGVTALVIAHRTCPRHAAENSLAGVAMAGSLGADAVEVDVRVTADGVPVLIHDAKLPQNGGSAVPVRSLPFEEFRRLSRSDDGLPVPTLEGALHVLPAGVVMAIDVKEARAAPPIVGLIEQRAEVRVQLWARSLSVLRYFGRTLPDVDRALLRDTRRASSMPRYVSDAARCGAHAISPRWGLISSELVADAHARGLKVYSMAEDAASQASRLAAGLDGLVTDWPEEARAEVW